jgi:hypothetical protein
MIVCFYVIPEWFSRESRTKESLDLDARYNHAGMTFPFSIFSIRAAGGPLQSHAKRVSIFICERVSTKVDAGISFIRARR